MLRKFTILVSLIAIILTGCNLTSQSKILNLKIAISGGVYGELEPCG